MTASTDIEYRYFAVDASADVSGDVVELTLDRVTWVTAAHEDPPDDEAAAAAVAHPVPSGKSRYWVRALCGPDKDLELSKGRNVVRGRVIDSPEEPEFEWTVYAP